MAAAAQRGLAVLPVVQSTPGWAARRPGDTASPPRDPATFGRFLAALVARYGPQGSLWAERPELPRVPIRDWQVWNEPNITRYWSPQPFAKSYVRLLRAAHAALHAADPGATVVLAGLPNESWKALRSIYRAGGRGHFDAVALHPYTRKPSDVMRLIRYARRVMRKRGDGATPVWVTELSWPAAKGRVPRPAGFEVSEAGQARRLRRALALLSAARERRRIARVFWYTWLSTRGRAERVRLVGPAAAARGSGGRRAGAGGVPALGAQARGLRQGDGRPALRLSRGHPRPASSITASTPSAVASQPKPAARARPAARSCSRRAVSASSASSAARNASPSGGTRIAAPPQVSGSADVSAATTGVPAAIASSTGRPKPS